MSNPLDPELLPADRLQIMIKVVGNSLPRGSGHSPEPQWEALRDIVSHIAAQAREIKRLERTNADLVTQLQQEGRRL